MKKLIKIEFECMCNLKCDYCFCSGENYETPIERVCDKIIELFKLYDPKDTFFRVEGVGEITLYPEVISLLNRMAEKGYTIEVLSNGILADKYINENNKLLWVISLDGHTVDMNKHRKLNSVQVSRILDTVISNNIEIQCVYSDQTMKQMIDFINYLESKNYDGFLHIFPIKNVFRLDNYLSYKDLPKVSFIQGEDYFNKWKCIYDTKKRNSLCGFFLYGYVYRIMHDEDEIRRIKCDCGSFMYESSKCRISDYSPLNCNTCINHFEYDVNKKFKYLEHI